MGNQNSTTEILCENGPINIAKADHVIINAYAAPFGDSFCPIYMVESNSLQTEVHQCKLLRSKNITQENFYYECKKAASTNDVFILYTTASSNELKLPLMSVIVHKNNWNEYFGPFSGRCYNYAMGPPDINSATFTQLTGFKGSWETMLEVL